MANSRRFPPADLRATVARVLDRHASGANALMLALSGGRDSVTLLDLLRPLCAEREIAFCAAHVHHGLSPHADEWVAFCETLCRDHAIGFHLARVSVDRQSSTSVEAAARDARYRALSLIAREQRVGIVALAQHADDQAETVLLQLARGAGPRGLAAMPTTRDAHGVTWLRPLLEVPRTAIDAYTAAFSLAFVDDDSNQVTRFRRNALRRDLVPALRAIAPGYPQTLVRAARLAGEASQLADDLARVDARTSFDGATLARSVLRELAPYRARNLLRWFLHQHGCRPPSAARLDAMLAQLANASSDAQVALAHNGSTLGLHAGRVVLRAPALPAFDRVWRGEASIELPHGRLDFAPRAGDGMRTDASSGAQWNVRARKGGERLTLDSARPRRRLKSLLREAGMPVWERDALPLVFCGDALAAVPGVGVDVSWRTDAGDHGVVLTWQPRPPGNR